MGRPSQVRPAARQQAQVTRLATSATVADQLPGLTRTSLGVSAGVGARTVTVEGVPTHTGCSDVGSLVSDDHDSQC